MGLVCGVDGCRDGWVAISSEPGGGAFTWRIARTFQELAFGPTPPTVIAVDIPIGLVDVGARLCDLEARRLLTPLRSSSVFPAPIRCVLGAGSYSEASAAREAAEGKRMSRQAWAIVRKIREVDEALRADPDLRARVREVHPEVSFYFLAGRQPMRFPKKKKEGRDERLAHLCGQFGPVIDRALQELRGRACVADDVLDAFVALWTAQRIVIGDATTLPATPARDRFGLPMEIVA